MDIDVILGSAVDRGRLAGRYTLSSQLIVNTVPVGAADGIIRVLGPSGRIGLLRIFDFATKTANPSFPTSQLARLRGRFEKDGSIEIRTVATPASPAPAPASPAPAPRSSSSNVAATGFSGGFSGGGFGDSSASTFNPHHLSSIVGVAVEVDTI